MRNEWLTSVKADATEPVETSMTAQPMYTGRKDRLA